MKERYGKRGIYIIDDACQTFMSGDGTAKAGTQDDIGCFSLMHSVFEVDEYSYPGFKFKLSVVLAAIGMGQLDRLDNNACN